MRSTPTSGLRACVAAAGATALVAGLAACSTPGGSSVEGASRGGRLTATDFADPAAQPQPRAPIADAAPPEGVAVERVGPVQANAGLTDAATLVGEPESAREARAARESAQPAAPAPQQAPAPEPGQPAARSVSGAPVGAEMIDSLVGQINGRPVYASEFFAPMDAQLRAEARRARSRAEWARFADDQIRRALIERMRDELLLAEFEASLTPEQRRGVLAFVQDLRNDLLSENLGSEALAQRRLLEEEGLTVEEKVRRERDRRFLRAQLDRVIGDRAYVSWREVQQAYEREFEQFNPPPRARLRVIQAPLRDPERVARVEAALAAGEEFVAVASRESAFNASAGGLHEATIQTRDYATATIFAATELNEQARALEVGRRSEPFDWNGSRFWLLLEAIEQPPARSLYDEQLNIFGQIRRERMSEEEWTYFSRLLSRASASDMDDMAARLRAVAAERYLPDIEAAERDRAAQSQPGRTPR